jgi:signal transduction histidine kinase
LFTEPPSLGHSQLRIKLVHSAGQVLAGLRQKLALATLHINRRFGAQDDLSARILQSQDAERGRIARQLHETVAQSLAALKMTLAKNRRSDLSERERKANLAESIALVESSMRQVRTLSYLLHPPLLEEQGLLSALRWCLSGFQERSGVLAVCELPEEMPRLPAAVESAVFRIVQECLTNIHRHSGSTTATVRLTRSPVELVLEVEDTGRGMPGGVLRGRPDAIGVGIAVIKERAQQLGGKLDIQASNPGTRIRVSFPLRVKI